MKEKTLKKAQSYLGMQHKDLQSVFTKIKKLEILDNKLTVYLDPSLRKFCQVANFIDHRLVLIVANSSIATQLRFQSVDLLRKFKQDAMLRDVQQIQCKIRLHFEAASPSKLKKMNLLSTATANLIAESAQNLKDAKLREVMERIAKHTKINLDEGS